jgi:hypothetical protein
MGRRDFLNPWLKATAALWKLSYATVGSVENGRIENRNIQMALKVIF